jgi:dipeptidyl aminopeptidase/acylaminoacyl peptidase
MLFALLAASAKAAAPLEAYGRLPSIEQATLSPDGTKVAFIQTTQDTRMLAIYDLVEMKTHSITKLGEQPVRSVEWADDTHLLMTKAYTQMPFELSGEQREWRLMEVFDLGTRKWRALLDHIHAEVRTMNVVEGRTIVSHKGNDTVLYVEGLAVGGVTHLALFSINLTTGVEQLVKEGTLEANGWVLDDSGQIVAEQDYFDASRRWVIRLYDGGRARQTVTGIAAIDAPEVLGLSAAGDEILFTVTEPQGYTWKPLRISDGTWGAEVLPEESLTRVILRNGSNRMVGAAFVGDTTRYRFSDKRIQEGWDWVERVFGYQRVEFVSASADYSKFIVEALGPKAGYAYYLADIKEHLTRPVGRIYGGVEQIAEVRAIKYKAADGLEIPAYLTLPPDRAAKMLPVIVFPHGGPQSRDFLSFDWFAQAMAAQGYAVLQPNYRGSSINKQWIEAGYGEWGRKMQTDLSDGLSYLAAQGIVDAKRACIVGASYGGYAALAGVSVQSGIYRCAVAVSGVSDPADFMNWVKRKEHYGDQVGLRYWERFLGVDKPGDKSLDTISPLKNAGRITVPMLLIHGRDDTTVPYDQSADLAKAMKRLGKPVKFVTLDKEDHYLSHSATRLQMLESSMDFLKANNPPDRSVAAAADRP